MRRASVWLLLSVFLAPARARADEEAELEPPTLVEFVEAVYPEEAADEGIEADVLLSIAVDETGLVTAVEVLEPAGHGFDEAAVDAAWQFEFEPATQDGASVASEIVYRYRFFLEKVPEKPLEKTPPPADGQGDEPTDTAAPEIEDEAEEEEYTTVVQGEHVTEEQVVSHSLSTEEVTKMPGTSGDLLKAVQSMPGVARAPWGLGLVIIRGSAPEDSLILMDDHPIPLAFHLGGMSSVVNAELIDEIEYVPGNFSVRYGRATGGLVNVKPRWTVPESWHAQAGFDAIDASIFGHGPIGDRGYLGISIRRSYVDLMMELAGKLYDDAGATAAPVYWDYQLFFMYRPGPDDEIRVSLVGDSDWLRTLFTDEMDDPALTSFKMRTMFHVLQLQWSHVFESGITYVASVQGGWIGDETKIGYQQHTDIDALVLSHRQDLRVPLGSRVELGLGVDMQPWWAKAKAEAPGSGSDVFATADILSIDWSDWLPELAFFGDLRIRAGDEVTIVPGVRVDWHGSVDDWQVQPRFVLRYSPWETTTFSAGAGVYSQPPSPFDIIEKWGNPYLVSPRAVHYAVGVEQVIPQAWLTVSLTGFYKTLDRLVEYSESWVERDGELVMENYDNDGRGRAFGLETMIRIEPGHIVYGWLSYTLQRSERWDHTYRRWSPFEWDQNHVLSLLLGLELPRGWNLSLRFRLTSGSPQWEVDGAVFDADVGTYVAFWKDRPTKRAPTFHQLDLRVDKKWTFRGGKGFINLYLDIQNVYYSRNPEYMLYTYDYTDTVWIEGLPLIPSIGLEGGF